MESKDFYCTQQFLILSGIAEIRIILLKNLQKCSCNIVNIAIPAVLDVFFLCFLFKVFMKTNFMKCTGEIL